MWTGPLRRECQLGGFARGEAETLLEGAVEIRHVAKAPFVRDLGYGQEWVFPLFQLPEDCRQSLFMDESPHPAGFSEQAIDGGARLMKSPQQVIHTEILVP